MTSNIILVIIASYKGEKIMNLIFVNEEDEYSLKQLYYFIRKNIPDWKLTYSTVLLFMGTKVDKQETMSDYEYFKYLEKLQVSFFHSQKYIVMENTEVISSGHIIYRTPNIVDISFIVDKNHRQKGIATKTLALVEENLFKKPNIYFTTITDMSFHHESSKIALKSGYIYDEELKYFVKINPHINISELEKKHLKI